MVYWYDEEFDEQLFHVQFNLIMNDTLTWRSTDTLRITFEYGYTDAPAHLDDNWRTFRHKLRFNKDGDDGDWYGPFSELSMANADKTSSFNRRSVNNTLLDKSGANLVKIINSTADRTAMTA